MISNTYFLVFIADQDSNKIFQVEKFFGETNINPIGI